VTKRIIVGLHEEHPDAGPASAHRIDIGPSGTLELTPQGIVEPGIQWYVAEVSDDTNLDAIVSRLIFLPQIAAAYPEITPFPPQ
jgi:hypothetical protein